jgi:hypothetical protein
MFLRHVIFLSFFLSFLSGLGMRILLLHIEIFVTVAAVCVVSPYLVEILKLFLVDLKQAAKYVRCRWQHVSRH